MKEGRKEGRTVIKKKGTRRHEGKKEGRKMKERR
jgi:hypothetical protein